MMPVHYDYISETIKLASHFVTSIMFNTNYTIFVTTYFFTFTDYEVQTL